MVTNTETPTEVLHSEKHTKLTEEEIAKAVARHNRHHPSQNQQQTAKPQKVTKNK